ncbi:MAG: CARDB domain-containing protein [Isosphaeraceae bacterium]|nr:CARDB domain-containing protein [Isosphaeraceae bacterium]
MSSRDRRAAGRRRAWGRGPIILRFEPLEGRALLSGLPDLVSSSFATSTHNSDWGSTVQAEGTILNQGNAPVGSAFQVAIYASATPQITRNSVQIGDVSIPAGLGPGLSSNYSETVSLPATPVPGFGSTANVYIATQIDPQGVVTESNTKNNKGLGIGYDTSAIAITPQQPALLQGASINVLSNSVQWGDTIQVTAQIRNNAQGNAPATRARLVLTPAGQAPGGSADYTIGNLEVPAIPAWQTANVQGSITLPMLPPPTLAGSQNFTLTLVPDADFQTNNLIPLPAPQGLGKDQLSLQIVPNTTATTTPVQGPLPDLAAGTLQVPAGPLNWGNSFQVTGTVENIGQADVTTPIRVRFLLMGPSGTSGEALFLGDAMLNNGLKAGYSQQLTQTLKLPNRLPAGLLIGSPTVARVEMIVDPEHTIAESFENNDNSFSAPFVVRIPGNNGTATVPNTPAVSATPNSSVTPAVAPTAKSRRVRITGQGKIVRRNIPVPHQSTTDKVVHGLTAFPNQVNKFVKGVIKNDL